MEIGFIGFGEAAFHISKGISEKGCNNIFAFDINVDHPNLGPIIQNRAVESGVTLVSSMKELTRKSSIIISATSAKFAAQIAKQCSEYTNNSHIYADLNATSPNVKKDIATYFKKKGVKFVDAAVMGSVPQYGHKVPILLSGEGAEQFSHIGRDLGMDLSVINNEPGSASAIKMARSVFVKGFTSLLIETLQVSQKFGIEKYMMNSIENTIQSKKLEDVANGLITRTAIHAERRVSEMDEVMNTLQSVQINPTMSLATKNVLQSIVEKDLRSYFNFEKPNNYIDVITVLNKKG